MRWFRLFPQVISRDAVRPHLIYNRYRCRWEMRNAFIIKDRVKAAGFAWDKAAKCWFTSNDEIAEKLKDYKV